MPRFHEVLAYEKCKPSLNKEERNLQLISRSTQTENMKTRVLDKNREILTFDPQACECGCWIRHQYNLKRS